SRQWENGRKLVSPGGLRQLRRSAARSRRYQGSHVPLRHADQHDPVVGPLKFMPGVSGTAATDSVGLRGAAGRWSLVALLTFCYAQRGTHSVAAPFMIWDLAINTETMGLMLSAFSWCYCSCRCRQAG